MWPNRAPYLKFIGDRYGDGQARLRLDSFTINLEQRKTKESSLCTEGEIDMLGMLNFVKRASKFLHLVSESFAAAEDVLGDTARESRIP